MEYRDYYKILGVPRNADASTIKKAYRKLAGEFHPDKNTAKGAEARFKEINEANEVLSDPEKRKTFDLLGENYRSGQQFQPPPGWAGRGGSPFGGGGGRRAGGGADFSDFFSSMFGGTGGGFHQPEPEPEDSKDLLTIALEESYNGGSRQITLSGGKTLDIKIPKGITEGQSIRLARQGRFGGDLLLEMRFAPHPQFTVEGRNLSCIVEVMPWQAALGGPVSVPTLGGAVQLTLPAGSSAGKKLRLRARGLPGSTPGDQFVELRIQTPAVRDEADLAFYEGMAKHFG